MSFGNLVSQKRLSIHSTSNEEISKLLAKAERDLSDAPPSSLAGDCGRR